MQERAFCSMTIKNILCTPLDFFQELSISHLKAFSRTKCFNAWRAFQSNKRMISSGITILTSKINLSDLRIFQFHTTFNSQFSESREMGMKYRKYFLKYLLFYIHVKNDTSVILICIYPGVVYSIRKMIFVVFIETLRLRRLRKTANVTHFVGYKNKTIDREIYYI